jgi:hypothetical protein
VTVRERWFGSTGRRVPEIAVEGSVDVTGAVLLDSVADLQRLAEAHRSGVPVVVRAATADEVVAALARPEVACVLVADEGLLALDLAELTYGE